MFPLRLVVAIVIWIVSIWVYLLMLAVSIGIPVAIGVALYGLVFGGGSDDSAASDSGSGITRSDSTADYLSAVAPKLKDLNTTTEQWSKLMDDHSVLDTSNLGVSEARQLANDELAAALAAKKAITQALYDIRAVVPPEACKDVHLKLVESLQLSERGFLEIISYMNSILRGSSGAEDARQQGNSLLNQSDQVKTRMLAEGRDCLPV